MTTTARELLQQAREAPPLPEPVMNVRCDPFWQGWSIEQMRERDEMWQARIAAIDTHLSEPDAQQAAAQPVSGDREALAAEVKGKASEWGALMAAEESATENLWPDIQKARAELDAAIDRLAATPPEGERSTATQPVDDHLFNEAMYACTHGWPKESLDRIAAIVERIKKQQFQATQAAAAGERSPTDYALEFAEYMAKGAEQFMKALNEEDALRLRREESDDVDDDTIYDAGTSRSEAMRGLRSDIYEFRKRRDRTIAGERSTSAEPTHQHVKSGGKYVYVGHGKLQTDIPLEDLEVLIAYRGEDGRLWFRPPAEFNERFQRLATWPPAQPGADQ